MPDLIPHSNHHSNVLPRMTRRQALMALGATGTFGAVAAMTGCEGSDYADYLLTGEVLDNEEALEDAIEVVEEVPDGTIDWTSMMIDSRGRIYYYPNRVVRSRFGIDVSGWSGDIDWAAVAADGVEFAIIRVGYRGYADGIMYTDDRYETNLNQARDAGIKVGAYYYSAAINEDEAREEAWRSMELLNGFQLDYPLAFDQEIVTDDYDRTEWLTDEEYTANARAFCEEVAAGGYQPMIYGAENYLERLYLEELADYPLWYAQYGVLQPTSDYSFMIWQYADEGDVAGVPERVDLNLEFF